MTDSASPRERETEAPDASTPGDWRTTHLWGIAAVRDVVWIAFGVLMFLLAFWLRDVLTPFLLAFAIAYVFKPLVDIAEDRWAVPRVVTSALVVLLSLGTLIGGCVYFTPLIANQVTDMATRVPEAAIAWLQSFGISSRDTQESMRNAVQRFREDPTTITGSVTGLAASAIGYLGRFVNALTYLATAAVIVPIYAFYFAWRYDAFLGHVKMLVPVGSRKRVLELFGRFDDTFGRFVRGRIAIGLVQVVLFCIGFWLVDIPFWFLLGVLTGLLCIIPIVGFVGWPLAILAKTIDGGDMMDVVVWPSIVYGIVQAIETWVLTPLVQGQSMNVSPFMILFSIIVGGSVGGFFGVLLAVPLANCIAILYTEEIQPRLDDWSRESNGPTGE